MAISINIIMHMPEADKTLTYKNYNKKVSLHVVFSIKKKNWEQPKCPSIYKLKECLRYSFKQGEGKLCIKYSPFL